MGLNQNDLNTLFEVIEKHRIKAHNGFKNFSQNLNYPQALVLDVESKEALSAIVSSVYKLNESKPDAKRILVRAAAGRRHQEYAESFSFTEGVDADIIIRLVGKEFRTIKKTNRENIMRVGASAQIGEVDKKLYDKFNLVLPTSSLIQYPTVSGLAANAGHGTGLHQPSFSGLIRGMTVCLPNGEITRIDESHPDFATIRAAHLGLFGIVLDLDMECVEAKKVKCIMDVSTIPDFIQKVKNGLFAKYPYVSVMYVPTYQKNEMTSEAHQNVIIYAWTPVDKSTPDENSCPFISHISQEIQIQLEEKLNVTQMLRDYPQLIPYFTRYMVSTVAIGKKDTESVGPWYTMHYQTAFPKDIDDADYLFEVGKNSEEIVTAMEKVVATLSKYAQSGMYPVLDAVYLRLFSGTNGGMSTSSHSDGKVVCGLDMVSSNGIPGYDEFKREMEDYFINGPLKSKPHWGKYVPSEVDYEDMYGENYEQFINALQNWYVKHDMKLSNSMLLNKFFCDILKLPYQPEYQIRNREKRASEAFIDSRTVAKLLATQVSTDHAAGEKLKKRLQTVANEKRKGNHSVMFDANETRMTEVKPDVKQRKDKKSCCIL